MAGVFVTMTNTGSFDYAPEILCSHWKLLEASTLQYFRGLEDEPLAKAMEFRSEYDPKSFLRLCKVDLWMEEPRTTYPQ
ncbi:hypothetical protein L596_018789 [Steinernema carpocapsae]|uniref:Uncharacterized protein n=1 Tax=Steinernema carpocapsae TaxID=34508 RepID=A0A4U5N667_STECR|nr:hypothetical protein L596_018789 [Steinernema carpocapsae]